MSLLLRKLVVILIMLGLPLQGVLAAIMPLCAQIEWAKGLSPRIETQIHPGVHAPSTPSAACGQHHITSQEQMVDNEGAADEMAFNLPCDSVVCHISGSGLPSATPALNPISGFSFAIPFSSRFTSFILQQPQRPPLA